MTRARAVCGTLLPATVLGLAIAHSATGDWTEFRGPTGQGLASSVDLPLEWSASEHVRWKTPLPGEGWSSPVVADGRVYLTAAVPIPESGDFSLRLIILDGASGQVIRSVEAFHQAEADAAQIHSKNSHASPTPLVDGDRVYVHFGPAGLACFNLAGEPIWRNDSFRYPPRHGNGGSPALAKGKLIFSCDGDTDPFILALEQETGDVAWKTPRRTDAAKTFSFATPLHIVAAGRDQVICPGSNCVVSLDPDTGDEIWRVNYDGYSVVPRPVFGHGLVYISTSFDSPVALAIRPDGQGDVTETHVAWSARRGAPNTPSMLLVGDYLYMVSDRGVASCLNAMTGEQQWQERLGGSFSASPIHANGRIYFQNEEGEAIVVRAAPTFELLARNDLQERTLASYAVVDQDLLIRTDKHLFRIGD